MITLRIGRRILVRKLMRSTGAPGEQPAKGGGKTPQSSRMMKAADRAKAGRKFVDFCEDHRKLRDSAKSEADLEKGMRELVGKYRKEGESVEDARKRLDAALRVINLTPKTSKEPGQEQKEHHASQPQERPIIDMPRIRMLREDLKRIMNAHKAAGRGEIHRNKGLEILAREKGIPPEEMKRLKDLI